MPSDRLKENQVKYGKNRTKSVRRTAPPSSPPRFRRGCSRNAQSQAARENGKQAQPAAKEKPARQQPPRKENKEQNAPAPSARGRHRGGAQGEAASQMPSSGRRGRGGNGGQQQAPAKEQNHGQKPSSALPAASAGRPTKTPGWELIARRPPKQKFANFEEYLAAHGGMTVPLPEEETAPVNDGAAQ